MSAISVTQLSEYIKKIIKEDYILKKVKVEGEISNISRRGNGHCYFTLKDDKSTLKCVVWRYSETDTELLKEGVLLQVSGNITVYPSSSSYQMIVSHIEQKDMGSIYLELEKRKKTLQQEGLFERTHKKSLPKYPFKIGVVTSEHGAAIRDIIKTIKRRYPVADIFLAPCSVQGVDAPSEIIRGIKELDKMDMDILIIGRGGGSFEELNAFNDEEVVRAVYECKTPIISAVGHEVDTLLTDFAADIRAATPTAGAELSTPNILDILKQLENYKKFMEDNFSYFIFGESKQLAYLFEQLNFHNPIKNLQRQKEKLSQLKVRFISKFDLWIKSEKHKMASLKLKLDLLNPKAILDKGYSMVFDMNNSLVKYVREISLEQKLNVQLSSGNISVVVTGVEEVKNGIEL